MSNIPFGYSGNHLIDLLPASSRETILALGEPVDVQFGTVLCESGQPFQQVYFPLTGFISIVASVDHHAPVEVGLIGNEGMLGATLSLGVRSACMRGLVQGAGSLLRLEAGSFYELLEHHASLHRVVNQYLYILMAKLTLSNACRCFHSLSARLAYWLLITSDRAPGGEFFLTHQFLADMLGVQRGAVTLAASDLQRQHIIRYRRGIIRVLNRGDLEGLACSCYSATLTRASPSLSGEPTGI